MSSCVATQSSCLAGNPVDRGRLARRPHRGLDLVAIWEWGVVERLSTQPPVIRIHLQPLGRDTLAAAQLSPA